MTEIRVADISRWQGVINWGQFKNSVQGVVIKATGADDGLYTDNLFARNRDEARRVGLPRWFYHFKGGAGSARQQADYFVKAVGPLQAGEALVLDDENEPRVNVNFVSEFADRVKELTGLTIVLYSNQARFSGIDTSGIKRRNIGAWSAKYGSNSGNPEPPPATAADLPVIMWQYTSNARVGGVSANTVDMNIFYGSVSQFVRYGNKGSKVGDMFENKTAEEWAKDAKTKALQAADAEQYKQAVLNTDAFKVEAKGDVSQLPAVLTDLFKFKKDVLQEVSSDTDAEKKIEQIKKIIEEK